MAHIRHGSTAQYTSSPTPMYGILALLVQTERGALVIVVMGSGTAVAVVCLWRFAGCS
jgi:hypothetical protein